MKQRGMGLIEIVIVLAICGVVVAGIWRAWNGFKTDIAEPYVQAQILQDKGTLSKMKAERDDANDRALHLDADLVKATEASAKQTQALEEANAQIKAAQDAARASAIKYAQAVAQAAARTKALQAKASAQPVSGRACAEVLSATDEILRESAVKRAEIAP